MTHRDWTKVGVRVSDPGAVVGVFDNGGIWCGNDDQPFVPRSLLQTRRAAKARKKRRKQQSKMPVVSAVPLALRMPAAKIHLIRSVMADLGRPIPNRISTLNRSLGRLIKDGVIYDNGDFNKSHPIIHEWFERVQSGKGHGK